MFELPVGPVGPLWSLIRAPRSCFERPGGGPGGSERDQKCRLRKREGDPGGCAGPGPKPPAYDVCTCFSLFGPREVHPSPRLDSDRKSGQNAPQKRASGLTLGLSWPVLEGSRARSQRTGTLQRAQARCSPSSYVVVVRLRPSSSSVVVDRLFVRSRRRPSSCVVIVRRRRSSAGATADTAASVAATACCCFYCC